MLAAEPHGAGIRYASGVRLGHEKWGAFKHQAAFLLPRVHFYHPETKRISFVELILRFSK